MLKKLWILIFILFMIVCVGSLIFFQILPNTYLLWFSFFYLCFHLLAVFLLKRKNKICGIIGFLFSFCLFVLSIVFILIIFRSQLFFNNVTKAENETKNYSVVVLNNSSYNSIHDIADKNIGILQTDDKDYLHALDSLKKKISFQSMEYSNEYLLAMALFHQEVDAILLNEAFITILDEAIEDFANNVKILNIFEVEVEQTLEEDNSYLNLSENQAFNVYISGIDTYGSIYSVSRSDVNIIATVNMNTEKILLTNIPRDMYVSLAGTSGLKDKLTHAGIYGIQTSVDTLENFLDTDIHYYVRINFSSLIQLVDSIGGIDVYSDYAFKADNRYYQKGMNYGLNGKEALAFSRNRYAFLDGDRQRGRNQERVIAAIIDKMTAIHQINTYLKILSTLENSFQTNISKDTINQFINLQIKNNYQWNIEFSDVNGYDSFNYTYSYPWQKLYVMEVDQGSLNICKEKMKAVLMGN